MTHPSADHALAATPLPFAVGLEFAHVLACAVAEDLGARALVIKGPSAAHHGLREPRVSADADVWVEPGRFADVVESLGRLGWHERPHSEMTELTTTHSVTLINDEWPCDIDLHLDFPGFLGNVADVFDALWARRESLPQAGVDVPILDLTGAILVASLHALRTPVQTPRHGREIRTLARSVIPGLSHEQRQALLELARATGAMDTARPVLELLGQELPTPTAPGESHELDVWRARVASGGEHAGQLMEMVSSSTWSDKPRLLRMAIWPSRRDFLLLHPEVADEFGAVFRGRVARLGRGFAAMPAVIQGHRFARRASTKTDLFEERR